MPSIEHGRKLVQNFIDTSKYSVNDLAKAFGITKQAAGAYISGKKKGKTASYFILDVIHTYKL
jgi:predicted transcriptional regulator